MADDNDNKIEYELALRDSMSPVLRSIQSSLESIVKTLDKASGHGADSSPIAKVNQQTYQLNERIKQTTGSVFDMGKFLDLASARLLGPAGLVFGFVAVHRELAKFATAQAQSRNFARDTGFLSTALSDMRVQFMRAGSDRAEANAAIGKFSKAFDDILSKQTSSTFFQQYLRYNQEAALDLLQLINQGKRWEALQLLRDDYLRNPEGGRYRAQLEKLFDTQTALWPLLSDNIGHAQRFWTPSVGVIETYLKKLATWKARWEYIKNSVLERAVAATELDPVKRKEFFDLIRKQEGTRYRPLPGANFPGALPFPGQVEETKEESNKVLHDIYDWFKRWWDQPATPRQEGGPVTGGKRYLVGENRPELFDFGGRYMLVGEKGPEVFTPSTSGQILTEAQAFTKGGLMGVLQHRGVKLPGWLESTANFFRDPTVVTALGFAAPVPEGALHRAIHGVGGTAAEFGQEHFGGGHHGAHPPPGLDASLFGLGGRYKLVGEGGPGGSFMEAGEIVTEELSALRYKNFRRSEEIEDERERVFGFPARTGSVPDLLPGRRGTSDILGRFVTDPDLFREGPFNRPIDLNDWEETMRKRDRDRGQIDRDITPVLEGELNFENVPPGVRVSTESEGFDSFTEHVNRQMAR